jgi:flagellar biosynthesis/type III secretory pathway chaperone
MPKIDRAQQLKSNPIHNELVIADLMTVMSDLIAVVESENDLLHRGLPAALSDYADRKEILTNQFTNLSRGVLLTCREELAEDDDLRNQIVATGQVLKSLSQENMRLLRGAMDATRRRINSVMTAIRAEGGSQGIYSASGTITAANFIERHTNYKA